MIWSESNQLCNQRQGNLFAFCMNGEISHEVSNLWSNWCWNIPASRLVYGTTTFPWSDVVSMVIVLLHSFVQLNHWDQVMEVLVELDAPLHEFELGLWDLMNSPSRWFNLDSAWINQPRAGELLYFMQVFGLVASEHLFCCSLMRVIEA